jgi:hypothetical protein
MIEFFSEFLLFLKERKKLWMAPLVLVLLALGAVLFLTQGTVLAPFIYSLF